jgi:hypothetical protein
MAADRDTEDRLGALEGQVATLTARLDELVRLLKRADDEEVQRAARRAR